MSLSRTSSLSRPAAVWGPPSVSAPSPVRHAHVGLGPHACRVDGRRHRVPGVTSRRRRQVAGSPLLGFPRLAVDRDSSRRGRGLRGRRSSWEDEGPPSTTPDVRRHLYGPIGVEDPNTPPFSVFSHKDGTIGRMIDLGWTGGRGRNSYERANGFVGVLLVGLVGSLV